MFLDSVYRYAKQQSAGLSGASAAKDLGISATSFNSFVNWSNSGIFPSEQTMKKIAVYIDWDYDDIYLAVQAARVSNTPLSKKLESIITPKKTRAA